MQTAVRVSASHVMGRRLGSGKGDDMSDESAEPAGSGSPAAGEASPSESTDENPLLNWLAHPFGTGFIATFGVLLALALGLALGSLSTVLIYITLALFVAIGLDPVVKMLERRGIARPWGIAIVFSALAVIIAVTVVFVLPPVINQLVEFAKTVPQAIADIEASDWYMGIVADYGEVIDTAVNQVKDYLSDPNTLWNLGGGVLSFSIGFVNAVSGGLIVVVLSLYSLASLGPMKTAMYQLAPARNRAKLSSLTERITESMGGYLMGMVILASMNAVYATILHAVLGLPFVALMGILALLITFIPLVGPVLYWITATVIALFHDPTTALIFAILYFIYIQIEAYVLTPRVMNRTISIPGSLVVIGALVGGTLLGLLGALVAIPITAGILLILKEVIIPRQDAKT